MWESREELAVKLHLSLTSGQMQLELKCKEKFKKQDRLGGPCEKY
jgi:hypothetical protein